MKNKSLDKLSGMQLDVLREIGNIGAGNAATSMSALINEKIDMLVPSVKIVSFDEVMEMIGGTETPVAGIMIHIFGSAPAKVYFILPIEQAQNLIKRMTGKIEKPLILGENPDPIAISALKESGNILTGSYISALSDFTGLQMNPSIPYLNIDMAGAILSYALVEVSPFSDKVIIIDTELYDEKTDEGIQGNFLLLPEQESFAKIFKSLGIKSYE